MKIAILGSGKIVEQAIEAILKADMTECHAICVREQSIKKGLNLCKKYNIEKIYTDYETLLNNNEINIVYVATPNNLHFTHIKAALEKGKHVICEKPFTSTYDELATLYNLAKTNKCMIFEAITTFHLPNLKKIKDSLTRIGKIQLVTNNFVQLSSRYEDYKAGKVHPVFDPSCSGGALYDLNIYNIYLTLSLWGNPTESSYICNKGFNGIDTSGCLSLMYDDFISVNIAAKDSIGESFSIINGEEGYIKINGSSNIISSFEVQSSDRNHVMRYNLQHDDNHMVYEFKSIFEVIMNNDFPICFEWLKTSMAVSKILETSRHQASISF
jgi:scyllo-inositol 2-dehydrogenase (NADP+)